jgi:hypothetical protein
MSPPMGYLSGLILVLLGVLVIVFGDRKLSVKRGVMLKAISHEGLNAKVLKWAIAILCIWFGVALIVSGGSL